MSKAAARSLPLVKLSAIAVLSAAIAVVFSKAALPLVRAQSFLPSAIAAYALVFVAAFAVLCLLGRHVSIRFSVKPHGLERVDGILPRFARVFLVVLVFAAPLLVLSGVQAKSGPSLESLISASEKKAAFKPEQGYKIEDRATLGKLMEEEKP